MPPRHNDEFRRVVLPEFKLHAFKPGLMSDLAISDQITAMHAPVWRCCYQQPSRKGLL